MKKTRLDKLLVERGVFADEAEALRAVLAHEVKVEDAYATSAAMLVAPDADVQVKGRAQYVSRGGCKLRGALDAFGFDPAGLRCIDVGCSTGGFTDCLLQAGAASVACVDVGYGDLAWKLRQDPRTAVFERTNIRIADPAELGAPFDLIVADLSFIGLASLAPVFAGLSHQARANSGRDFAAFPHPAQAAPGSARVPLSHQAREKRPHPATTFIGLVKPQFESRHEETDHGVVRDESVRIRTIDEVRAALEQAGFTCEGVIESPITGKRSGNVEYLLKAVFGR